MNTTTEPDFSKPISDYCVCPGCGAVESPTSTGWVADPDGVARFEGHDDWCKDAPHHLTDWLTAGMRAACLGELPCGCQLDSRPFYGWSLCPEHKAERIRRMDAQVAARAAGMPREWVASPPQPPAASVSGPRPCAGSPGVAPGPQNPDMGETGLPAGQDSGQGRREFGVARDWYIDGLLDNIERHMTRRGLRGRCVMVPLHDNPVEDIANTIRSGTAPHDTSCHCSLCSLPRGDGWAGEELERRIRWQGEVAYGIGYGVRTWLHGAKTEGDKEGVSR